MCWQRLWRLLWQTSRDICVPTSLSHLFFQLFWDAFWQSILTLCFFSWHILRHIFLIYILTFIWGVPKMGNRRSLQNTIRAITSEHTHFLHHFRTQGITGLARRSTMGWFGWGGAIAFMLLCSQRHCPWSCILSRWRRIIFRITKRCLRTPSKAMVRGKWGTPKSSNIN